MVPFREALFLVGKKLGHYEILDKVGAGGMGEIVYGNRDGIFAVAVDASGASLRVEPAASPLALVVNWTAELDDR